MTELDPFTDDLDGPVYVVTVAVGAERAGCLVGFASQCSIDPPRFIVWLSVANHTYRVARGAEYLTVHLLRRDDRALAELFGGETGDRVDKFAAVGWLPGEAGSPVLAQLPTWFTGRIEGCIEGGDHVGFLLAPAAVCRPGDGPPPPLLRYRELRNLEPGHPA
ncbi:flavin reductase family protein [Streptomyces lavendulae]|uniref:NADH:riboflavin 5'-phosphate oxidoreductase n=1 Tax=Streptomyces lavendulae subsp. lavendulae TaxID=58340 RepID=A0A2K8PN54_STRLA|nr:flavin reductase family protein [Streptomyces lavendulae]ATZ28149.1 NADH:riboflavin 5'-phosphate oxidoreductase [Streptomyces lavendulae subsp. lavendulae]QUQ57977.1 FMN reductase (NADH) RutF [Streptomyces lavendulae subsp. lavendulae]